MMGKGQPCRWHGSFVRYLLAMACAFLPLFAAATVAVSADDPPTLQSNVTHAGTLVGRTNAQQQVSLAVPLKIAKQSELDAFLHDLYDQTSPAFHRYLTPADFTKRFVDASARKQVADFLRSKQLTVTDSGLGTVINATGTVAQVESAFSVTISDYRDSTGKVYFGNDRTAALPASIAALTQGVIGLDNAPSEHPAFVQRPLDSQSSSQAEEPSTPSGCAAAVNVSNRYGSYTPNQISAAYGLGDLYDVGFSGQGQTVALVELDDYLDSNVAAYQACFGTTATVVRVPFGGGATLGESGGELEVELDIDVVIGHAPRLGQLLVYETHNTTSNATALYQQIANDNIAQVASTSWGNCEQNRSATTLNARNAIFQQMAAQGISMFASEGDNGSTDCLDSNGNIVNAFAVHDPASQPFVTGVGGTSLLVTSGNVYGGEVVWNRASQNAGAGGGGLSVVWPKPTYQVGPGTVNAFSNGMRQTPDVVADADPFTAYTIFGNDPKGCPIVTGSAGVTNCFLPIGGTSAAAPLWASMTVLMNQYMRSTPLGFLNPFLYSFLPNISNPDDLHPFPFRDIVSGSNCYRPSFCGSTTNGTYPATVGYDQASGLGSPIAKPLTDGLFPPFISVFGFGKTASGTQGGTVLTITGSSFQAGMTVTFGGVPSTNVVVNSPFSLTVTTPPHSAGNVQVQLTNPSGRSRVYSGTFTYIPVVITQVSPNYGPTTGTPITITGASFEPGATVTIGGAAATGVNVVNATQITCTVPPTAAVAMDVVVNNPDGSLATLASGFRAQDRPGPVLPGAQPQPVPIPRP